MRRNEECGADSHKMWLWGAALSTLYHHCIASSPRNAKNLQHGTGQKTHRYDKEYVTNIQPRKLFKSVAVEKKSFYKNAKFCLVWSQNVFVNHLKQKCLHHQLFANFNQYLSKNLTVKVKIEDNLI